MRRSLLIFAGLASLLVPGMAPVNALAASPATPEVLRARVVGSASSAESVSTPGGEAVITPVRVLDTSRKIGLSSAVPAHAEVALPLPHLDESGWSADLRLTVVDPHSSGQISVSGLPSMYYSFPGVSFSPGRRATNLAVAIVAGEDDDVSPPSTVYLRNDSTRPVNLVVDFTGYTVTGDPGLAGLLALPAPQRLLDTKTGVGAHRGTVAGGRSVSFVAAGPNLRNPYEVGTNASGVLLEVTATSPHTDGYLTAGADGSQPPTTRNVSFTRNASTTSLVEVPVGRGGKVTIANHSTAAVGITADLVGIYQGQVGRPSWGGAFQQVKPSRLFDTLTHLRARPVPAHSTEKITVTCANGVSTSRTAAVLMNLTTVNPGGNGSLTAYATGTRRPLASNVLITRGVTSSSLSMIPVSSDGTIELSNSSAHPVQVLGDIDGYYLTNRPAVANALPTWSGLSLPQPAGDTPDYQAISCAAPDFCALLGFQPGTANDYVTTVQGHRVTGQYVLPQQQTVGDTGLDTISCTSASFCMTDPDGGISYRFDGQHWSQVPGPTPIGAISCGTPTFCLNLSGSSAKEYDGTQWKTVAGPTYPTVDGQLEYNLGLSCTGPSFCMSIGNAGDSTVYNGSDWQAPVHAYTPLDSIDSVSCSSPQHCLMLDRAANVTTYTNGHWGMPYNVSFGGTPGNITCPSTGFCAVADGNNVITDSKAGWSTQVAFYDSEHNWVQPISCASPTYCAGTDYPNHVVISS